MTSANLAMASGEADGQVVALHHSGFVEHQAGERDLLRHLPQEVGADFLRRTVLRSVADGSSIYFQGDPGNEMFRIASGSVRLSLLRNDGRELIYYLYGPGECFGYLSIIDGGRWPLMAEALGAVQLQVLRRDHFNELRDTHPSFSSALLRIIARDMRHLIGHVADTTFNEVPSRLARLLLDEARPDGSGQLAINLPQADLALLLGASRQTVNKMLNQFERQGLVSLNYGAVVLRDRQALKSWVDAQARRRAGSRN